MNPENPAAQAAGFLFWGALFARNLVAALPALAISRDNPPLLNILYLERL
ncbi:hypothetical protein [Pseudomonas wenzhouensis]|nr:hypothetical protein [Pseudomonas wenzhouensis]UFQ96831.1 hypothetical protein J7655_16270 [Pseudomonas wenzhouensis]